ncbi:MAG: GNAT family N-acetyltransferase [Anaerolineae bacterium]|jgi:CelD/BcsL family acetyltransferase involved in cellulose biosynthesis|nr:GNAT family N-acetyltransferase [Anaerolineae bacterium]MBT4310630.1 GNAT family N-acetyltransferase [Anaerolineae bacterium]MBT4456941.1 GNAT family N-acetyltransferase [Anaerolineae bacterium]MBT4843671.1 GNAT family N-acetyltransferase [Anaerolineae bacterium]MBT6060337.1 GNAT family N-acetyltransferase [Anaerolineae bacterium]
MEIVHSLEESIWRRFVYENPAGNIFHTPEMFQVFSRAYGHQPMLWAAVQDERVLALFIPVEISLGVGILHSFTTRSVCYGGVLCSSGSRSIDALAELLSAYTSSVRRKALFTEIRNVSDNGNLQSVLLSTGFSYDPHLNYIVDLDLPIEKVWENISPSGRRGIKKAGRRGDRLFVWEVQDKETLPQWYRVMGEAFSRIHVPLAHFSLFETAFEILYPKKMIQFLIGEVDDQGVASSVALLYKNTLYGWFRGYDRSFKQYLPNDLMVWHVFRWGVENDYKAFDFGGAGRPAEEYGPRNFKAKFGGRLVNYGRNTIVHAPTRLKLSGIGYRLLRRLL